ncbi:TetR/AcrR family transcriptional regulator [Herbiconiux sp. CPCC 205716]|uniref:TetR/AcrR family transcriptional regulator n=1 Tax=Herbiconiux gentiana TaxID=2970912 RepID=A0ABT2GKN3_9MICO|nr:TetR/AcrR family transcriptional regulator [Herbiconiux gentiana]MCS5716162.1 TetR/AcrR family transcriptional regulator [Herbiconiux gentiana]
MGSVTETRDRILDVAIGVLGASPEAGMGEVAATAGVVRRTVYGYFPTRADLVNALAKRAADELAAVLVGVAPDEAPAASDDPAPDAAPAANAAPAAGEAAVPADVTWARFVARLWPVAHRYRVLVVLRRGEFGTGIHALLAPVEQQLAGLVARGQDTGVFGRHLPADALAQVVWSALFTLADAGADAAAAATTTLLMLGVPAARASQLAGSAVQKSAPEEDRP